MSFDGTAVLEYTWPYTAVLSQLVRSRMFKKEVTRMVTSLLLTMLLTTAVPG